VYLKVKDQYELLNSGSALGRGCGPLLIAKKNVPLEEVKNLAIAIPGENTTANLLFSIAFPEAKNKKVMLFNEIENAVLNGDVDAGVIIHENRFTYQQKGLHKLVDLGEYWERQTGNPIPLGGIVMKKAFDSALQKKVDALIKRSLEYSFKHYPLITDYVKQHSQEMSETVMRQHIDLYVNNYSLQLGADGRSAVNTFLDIYEQLKKVATHKKDIFLAAAG
jgi:1,4-dihydroxy-6-naphthoate synthase